MAELIVFVVVVLISLGFALYFYRDAVNKLKKTDAEIKEQREMLARHQHKHA